MERLFTDTGAYTIVANDFATKIEQAVLSLMQEYVKAGYQHRDISNVAMLAVMDVSLVIALEQEGVLKF